MNQRSAPTNFTHNAQPYYHDPIHPEKRSPGVQTTGKRSCFSRNAAAPPMEGM